jgi:hypothetical protein
MGGFYSSGKKDFQSVTPYPTSVDQSVTKKFKVDSETSRAFQKKTALLRREPSLGPGWVVNVDKFNFDYTEGQHRRGLMANCEDECSEITDFLYVGGSKVLLSVPRHASLFFRWPSHEISFDKMGLLEL